MQREKSSSKGAFNSKKTAAAKGIKNAVLMMHAIYLDPCGGWIQWSK